MADVFVLEANFGREGNDLRGIADTLEGAQALVPEDARWITWREVKPGDAWSALSLGGAIDEWRVRRWTVVETPPEPVPVPDPSWCDEDGQPLGGWVVIDYEEWDRIVEDAGGMDALTVFAGLTDPDGQYGKPTTYTAYGVPGAAHPLVDARDREPTTWRRFVPTQRQEQG